jgi:hypothetical protein
MKLVNIYNAAGMLEAEMIKTYLESFDVVVFINQESLGRTLGLSAGPLGMVEVMVPESQLGEAQTLLREMWDGKQIEEFMPPDDQNTEDPTIQDSMTSD